MKDLCEFVNEKRTTLCRNYADVIELIVNTLDEMAIFDTLAESCQNDLDPNIFKDKKILGILGKNLDEKLSSMLGRF